jgi:hypothetical protein
VLEKSTISELEFQFPANITKRRKSAGIAQLVERNLAKVEVASSSLVSRSSFSKREARLPFFVDGGG